MSSSTGDRGEHGGQEQSGPRTLQRVIDIPTGIPCGLVIGKAGLVIKALQHTHQVRARVDDVSRQVILHGAPDSIAAASEDLALIFKRIQANKRQQDAHGSRAIRGGGDTHNNRTSLETQRHPPTQAIPIPANVLPGAVIGKNGVVIKGLCRKYDVKAHVNVDERTVVMKGVLHQVEKATEELKSMFDRMQVAEFATNGQPFFRACAVRDGPKTKWLFRAAAVHPSDIKMDTPAFELLKGDPVPTQHEFDDALDEEEQDPWIRNFDDKHLISLSQELDTLGSTESSQLRLVFGQLLFNLHPHDKTPRDDQSTFTWHQLRRLQRRVDFTTTWSNVLTKRNFKLKDLLLQLEAINPDEIRSKTQLNVHVRNVFEKRNCTFKYRLENETWELVKWYDRGCIQATYDVMFDDQLSFRVRATSRQANNDTKWQQVARHLRVQLPHTDGTTREKTNDAETLRQAAFASQVELDDHAPLGFRLEGFMVRHKMKVTMDGLTLTLSYLDAEKTELGLACRLQDKTWTNCGEAFVMLIHRVFLFLTRSYGADGA